MRTGPLWLAIGALFLCAIAACTIAGISPPEARPADAPATEFSAARALTHVAAISKSPHPVGSPAHEDVRAYVLGVIGGLGLETRVEDTTTGLKVAGVVYGAHVQNVIARLPGTRPGPAILLAAHYDSVPQSRGASDDGSGVATLLETARALLAGPRLKNDVLFLFSDAEEIAACGAYAFTTEELATHPIALALNFEARGTRGAVALYDTSTNNGALIAAIAAAAPRVVSNSLLASLARALPNDSDATIWKRAGIPTYAFAYVDHLYQYHRYTDSLEALDPRSLQHDGDYALPLVRGLGDRDLPLPESAPVTYFDLFGRSVVSYSTLLARALALLTLAFLVALTVRARRVAASGLTVPGIVIGAAVAAGALALSGALAGLVHVALRVAIDPFVLFAKPLVATAAGLAAGASALLFVCVLALRRWSAARMVFGALYLWATALLVTATFVPAASFVFQWPLLFAVGGTTVWVGAGDASGPRVDAALAIMLAPAAFFWSYLGYTLFVMVGPSAPEVVVVASTSPLLLAVPVLARIGAVNVRRLGTGVALAALGIAGVGGAMVRGSPELRRPDSLTYTAERQGKVGHWATSSAAHDDFVSRKIPDGRTSATEPAEAGPPLETETHSVDEGDLRHITLTVTSPRHARCVRFWEVTKDPITKVLVNDKLVVDVVRFSAEIDERLMRFYTGGPRQAAWVGSYCGAGGEPFKLDLYTKSKTPVKMRTVEISDGFPGPALRPRSATDGYPDVESDTTSITFDMKL